MRLDYWEYTHTHTPWRYKTIPNEESVQRYPQLWLMRASVQHLLPSGHSPLRLFWIFAFFSNLEIRFQAAGGWQLFCSGASGSSGPRQKPERRAEGPQAGRPLTLEVGGNPLLGDVPPKKQNTHGLHYNTPLPFFPSCLFPFSFLPFFPHTRLPLASFFFLFFFSGFLPSTPPLGANFPTRVLTRKGAGLQVLVKVHISGPSKQNGRPPFGSLDFHLVEAPGKNMSSSDDFLSKPARENPTYS